MRLLSPIENLPGANSQQPGALRAKFILPILKVIEPKKLPDFLAETRESDKLRLFYLFQSEYTPPVVSIWVGVGFRNICGCIDNGIV